MLALILAAVPARAQNAPVRVRGEAILGYEHFLASQTFEGIFGTANAPVYGGGVDVGLSRHVFVRVDATRFNKTGERAFVANGVAYKLGIPLTVTITPVIVTAGYRAPITRSRLLSLYAGAGAGSWSYSEKTDDPTESAAFRKTGYVAVGGLEWRLDKWVALGVEGQYASVPSAIGSGGISQQFNENNLGGASAALRFIVGR